MNPHQLQTPVVLLIFNRPDTTAKVLAEIAKAKPAKLFVVADGPRPHHPTDSEMCAATRAIINRVDWECKVVLNYSDVNLGCQKRVSSGLDWVFEQTEEAIILEDDCIPDPSFFRFCTDLLDCYRDDERILMISGNNFQFGYRRTEYSYYYSKCFHIWGWATWRRAWQLYDGEMSNWELIKSGNWLRDILQQSPRIENYWANVFESVYQGKINSWAYRWLLTCWLQNGTCILPSINLVSNIGFGSNSTHTNSAGSLLANIPAKTIDFPLRHPPIMVHDTVADQFTHHRIYTKPTRLRYWYRLLHFYKYGVKFAKRMLKPRGHSTISRSY